MSRRRLLANVGLLFSSALFLLWTALHFEVVDYPLAGTSPNRTPQESRLHLLVVATSNDLNLCRLLLSASILSYPSPILIDWDGEGEFNAAQSHLAKIHGPIRYLNSLKPEQDDDLVLMVDGYDILFQLGPDVLIKRYFSELKAADDRLVAQYGADHVRKHGMINTILFGPDKVCWPENRNRAACWAVPDSTLPTHAFGPYTDNPGDMPHARPRWLNSGTIVGPVRDMRKMFVATKAVIEETYDPQDVLRNSDQKYFADLWGRQEVARTVSKSGQEALVIPQGMNEAELPVLKPAQETEYHIGLDYTSALFQTAAGYVNYLACMVFNRSEEVSQQTTVELYRIGLTQDILDSKGPPTADHVNIPYGYSPWKHVPLVFNTVSGWIFPILHFTGDKERRDYWWPRMWYASQAESLHRLSQAAYTDAIGGELIHGTRWKKHEPHTVTQYRPQEVRWNIWSDQGGKLLSWDQLCKQHESSLYGTTR